MREEFNISNNTFVITYIGRISPEKGIKYLIESANIVKKNKSNFKILIVGDGEDLSTMKKFTKRNFLDDVIIFTGYRENIQNIFEATDILVQPSLTEGLPLSILEAMYYKVPVIATAVGGIPDVIKDGETGILIEPANKEQLARALLSLHENSDLKEKITRNSFDLVTQDFMIDTYCDKLKEIYYKEMSMGQNFLHF